MSLIVYRSIHIILPYHLCCAGYKILIDIFRICNLNNKFRILSIISTNSINKSLSSSNCEQESVFRKLCHHRNFVKI